MPVGDVGGEPDHVLRLQCYLVPVWLVCDAAFTAVNTSGLPLLHLLMFLLLLFSLRMAIYFVLFTRVEKYEKNKLHIMLHKLSSFSQAEFKEHNDLTTILVDYNIEKVCHMAI